MSTFEFFPTFGYLKKSMHTFFRPTGKSAFGIHDPVGLRYLFQLRLGLSNLHTVITKYVMALLIFNLTFVPLVNMLPKIRITSYLNVLIMTSNEQP